MTISDLPYYIDCGECPNHHFLNIVRQLNGQWAIAYVEFENGQFIPGLALNNCKDFTEAAFRMNAAITRWKRRGERDGGSWQTIYG